MKFYFREKEIEHFDKVDNLTKDRTALTVLYGNRKVGKTEFIKEFLSKRKGIYLSISTNNSKQQLADITTYLKSIHTLNTFIPTFTSFTELLEFFFYLAKEERFYLAIDEIQNFEIIEKGFAFEFKNLLEKYSKNSKLFITLITFNLHTINQIFNSKDAPLYEVADALIKIHPFNLQNVIAIYKDNNSLLSINEIIKVYLVFGGLPKFYYLIDVYKLWNSDLNEVLKSLVIEDYAPLGITYKETILTDFTRINKTYLSILQAIALGKRTISEISESVNMPATTVMKYLIELNGNKNITTRKLPIHLPDKSAEKFGKYFINSFFDNFWFRFVHPNQIYFELRDKENILEMLKLNIIEYLFERAYSLLKEFFVYNLNSSLINEYFPYKITEFGPIWNRKASIDLALVSSHEKKLLLIQVLNKDTLEERNNFLKLIKEIRNIYEGYKIKLMILSRSLLSKDELQKIDTPDIVNLEIREFLRKIEIEEESLLEDYHYKSEKTVA